VVPGTVCVRVCCGCLVTPRPTTTVFVECTRANSSRTSAQYAFIVAAFCRFEMSLCASSPPSAGFDCSSM